MVTVFEGVVSSRMGVRTGDDKFFLTGRPGSGKSTLLLRCVKGLRRLGFTVGGIATPELRREGRRIGFNVVDLASGRRALLAGVEVASSFRVGRYGVDLTGFESVALPALDYAEGICDVVCIDEIGRMELFSRPFKRRVEELIRGPKPMIAVLHRRYAGTYSGGGTLLHVSPENRERLALLIVKRIESYLRLR
jgi:nucleoside-triphosphatase